MILSRISLQGFKSFAKKAELQFDGRVTGIVGPNGCGKTNIVDAIRWGLGEQKPSILRADRMDNIIFSGAQSSRPLGMAEVSIVFDNSSHVFPIDYEEVVVSRRLFRSGESEYLLNKTPVRLKDITDLFMDTGMGANAYSVIELRMVEDILSDKAEDRRKLLEEAAGVTKYKHRLKAAERKLDATQSDLLRVNDIIQEVERNVRSLKRQVGRAKRYQSLEKEIRSLELNRGRQLYEELQVKIQPVKQQMLTFQKEKEGRTTVISKEEADLETLRLNLVEREKALVEIQEALGVTVEQIHQKEGDIRVARERIASLEDRITRNTREIETLGKRLDDQEAHLEVSLREREALQVKVTSTGRLYNNKSRELDVFQQGLNLKRLELNKDKKNIISCLEEINQLNSEETKLRAKVDNYRGHLERLDEEDRTYQENQKKAQNVQMELNGLFQKLQKEKHQVQTHQQKLKGEEERLQKAMGSDKEQFYRDQSERDLLQGRLSFLQNVMESHEGMTDGAKMLLKAGVGGLLGVVADVLQVAPEHQHAIETGLGEASRYLLFNKFSHVLEALKFLKEKGGGRATLICMERVKQFAEKGRHFTIPRGINVVGWGDDLVRCKNEIRPVVVALLGDLLVVKNLSEAQKAVDTISNRSIRVATLGGELVTQWGIFQTGETVGQESGIVGRLRRIKELKKQIQGLKIKIAHTEKSIEEKSLRSIALQKEKEERDKGLVAVEERIVFAEKQKARTQFEAERAEEGLRNNGEEREKLLEEIERSKDQQENIRPQIESLLDRREQMESAISRIQMEVDRLEEAGKAMEEEVHRLNLMVVRLKGESQNLDYDIERSQNLIEEIKSTVEQRNQEIETAQEEIAHCREEMHRNEKAMEADFVEKTKQEKNRQEREGAYQALREELQNKEREVRQIRRDREATSDHIHNLEMEIANLEHQMQSLKERIQENYSVDLEKFTLEEGIDLTDAEEQIDTLKQKMRSLGPVNLIALQEYEQGKERLDFLHQQRDDLISAEETLNETIQRINQTARQRFGEVFKQVQKNFKETFCCFFQDGQADLRLPPGEDPLEARIEIVARPAGKQLRDLDLLSGGEKALTAISLLFALYLVKPSPFCILDEIDAPLDDANIERFTHTLAEYAKKTQFIIVTHNKMTMRVAQALYGVTMEEEGVSKIVSVKFEEAEKDSTFNEGGRDEKK